MTNEYYTDELELDGDERNVSPENSLELNLRLINSVWGQSKEVPQGLRDSLSKTFVYVDPETQQERTVKKSNWSLLGFFTRDFRLANLDSKGIEYCEYYSQLANEWIAEGFSDPFNIALGRIAGKLELSQSKNGFLRKNNNTARLEKSLARTDPERKGLFQTKVGK